MRKKYCTLNNWVVLGIDAISLEYSCPNGKTNGYSNYRNARDSRDTVIYLVILLYTIATTLHNIIVMYR